MSGLSKLWGHPFITGAEGIEKLYSRVTEVKTIDLLYLTASWNLMRDYTKQYLRVHGVWPPLLKMVACPWRS